MSMIGLHRRHGSISVVGTIFAALALTLSSPAGMAAETSPGAPARPSIWVTAAERPLIQEKIADHDWARELYETLKSRADDAAPEDFGERRARILAMPLVRSDENAPPILLSYTRDTSVPVDPEEARRLKWGYPTEPQEKMLEGLQDAIDCGVLYYLTSEEQYAVCAADILHLFVQTLNNIPAPAGDPFNSGWLYRQDHLLEARLVGAQLPIIYDLIHPYLNQSGQVYDAGADELISFSIPDAQHVFRIYANLALTRGLYDSNWPLLEMSSLINNTLALDDPDERNALLLNVLEEDTEHQPSLETLNGMLAQPGDIWPESLTYSLAVGRFLIYTMTLLDRNFPDLGLGRKYPNVLSIYGTYYNLQFPNGEYPAFGDSRRKIEVDYPNYEIALSLTQVSNDAVAEARVKGILRSSVEAGRYNRGKLPTRNYGAEPYSLPLQLLWSSPNLDNAQLIDLNPPRPTTLYLPYAGIAIQRNVNTPDPEESGLMAVMGGAAYIHGHASGIDLELYGQGSVLGVESGRSAYGSDIHENYYRLFAAHNTVISNGASASSGQWVGLGTDTAEIVAIEPALGADGVSPSHSFATMAFHDEFNLVAPADHQRTVALVRLSETSGYYVDVFRARSDTPDQFHDYVYRNLGDTMELTSNGADLTLTPDPDRYLAPADQPWERNATFRHPGWHFFEDVATADIGKSPVSVTFTADDLGDAPVNMRVHIPGGAPLQLTRVTAPESSVAEPPYSSRSIPAFVLRRQGEAWSNPFVAVYESDQGKPAVRSVEQLSEAGQFKGVRVTSDVDGQSMVQYILVQEPGQIYTHPELPLRFDGRFGVLTVSPEGGVQAAYIGDGASLAFGDFVLETAEGETSASWTRP